MFDVRALRIPKVGTRLRLGSSPFKQEIERLRPLQEFEKLYENDRKMRALKNHEFKLGILNAFNGLVANKK